jgi:hypothetical protein
MLISSQLINFVEIMVVFILTGSHYFIKENCIGLTLLEGRSEGGLYPLHLHSFLVNM